MLNGAPNVGVSNKRGPGGQFLSPQQVQVDATLRRFGRTMERHVQGFMNTQRFQMPSNEMTGAMELVSLAITLLTAEYRPEGFNVGLNQGRVAGAGIVDHLHIHVVPRWNGDNAFISVVGETRVLPEELETTYDRLKGRLDG